MSSLQATWIRNSILRALRESHPAIARQLSQNFVYDHPSILRLAEYLSASVADPAILLTTNAESKRKELYDLVSKYTKDFPSFKAVRESRGSGATVVLLTGGTGSLGANILAKLIQRDDIQLVYAMSRPSSSRSSSKERHASAFERENLDTKMLDSPKVRFVDGDAERADLAVDLSLYEEVFNLFNCAVPPLIDVYL